MYFEKMLNFKTHIILTILLTLFMFVFNDRKKRLMPLVKIIWWIK